MIDWIKINKYDRLPKEEVLAYGYQGLCLVGVLNIGQHGLIKCESDETELLFVTHYALLDSPPTD